MPSSSTKLLDAARASGFKGIIAGTRKTTPGFRLIEKYGMLVGGVDAHRYDLSSMVMLKDNHIVAAGSVPAAVAAARAVAGFSVRIDVEVQDEKEAEDAIAAGADVIMLDNLDGPDLGTTAKRLRTKFGRQAVNEQCIVPSTVGSLPAKQPFLLESSGGITLANLQSGGHLDNSIDIVSTSAIHQSTQHVDFSLKVDP